MVYPQTVLTHNICMGSTDILNLVPKHIMTTVGISLFNYTVKPVLSGHSKIDKTGLKEKW